MASTAVKGVPLAFPDGSQVGGKRTTFFFFLSGSAFMQAGKRLRLLFLASSLTAGLAQVSRARLAHGVPSGGTANAFESRQAPNSQQLTAGKSEQVALQ